MNLKNVLAEACEEILDPLGLLIRRPTLGSTRERASQFVVLVSQRGQLVLRISKNEVDPFYHTVLCHLRLAGVESPNP